MSKIEWTEETWNFIMGCTPVTLSTKSQSGCTNCYAKNMAWRLQNMGTKGYDDVVRKDSNGEVQWTGKINFQSDALSKPVKKKKPTLYFVESMGDLFHKDVKYEWLESAFSVMSQCPQHTFQILTKRSQRASEYLAFRSPLNNVWIGTSIETQEAFEARAYHLQELKQNGWKTFYSCEPLLEPLNLSLDLMPVDLVITGYESGHGAREPISGEDAVRSLRDQCVATGTKFFYKQKVENGRKISLPELDGKVWSDGFL